MNEKLEALNQEIEKTEKKLQRAQHEEKMLEHQIKTLTRKERTHRLCTRAAMLESYLPHPEAITDEQVSVFLKLLFHKDSTRQLMEKVFAGNSTEKEGAIIHHPEVGALRSPKAPRRRAVIFRSQGLLQIIQGTLRFPCAGCRQLPFCGLAIWGHLAL